MTSADNGSTNGWEEYGRHVLAEMKRLSVGQDELRQELQSMSIQLARIEGHSAWISKIDERVTAAESGIVKLELEDTKLAGELKLRTGLISVLVSILTAVGIKVFGPDLFGGH
jgi:hypothetical protein